MKSNKFSKKSLDDETADLIDEKFPAELDVDRIFKKSYQEFLRANVSSDTEDEKIPETIVESSPVEVIQSKHRFAFFTLSKVCAALCGVMAITAFYALLRMPDHEIETPEDINKTPIITDSDNNTSTDPSISTTAEKTKTTTYSAETTNTTAVMTAETSVMISSENTATEFVINNTEHIEETTEFQENETEVPTETTITTTIITTMAATTTTTQIEITSSPASFDNLLSMSDDELMKYCDDNGFTYVSQDEIKNELKFGGIFFIRMNPEKYLADGIKDVCISENISDISEYNVNDYDFDKMIADLDFPEEYFSVKVDDTPFMVCMESKITENGDMKPYFIKLANLSIKITPEFSKSELSLRLYQLIKILPQGNNNFHSISIQYLGGNNLNDND